MSTVNPTTHPAHRSPYAPFERATERLLGADMRLLYGMAVPVVALCVIIALALGYAASAWVVAGLMVLEAIMLGIVMVGFIGVLNSGDDSE